MKVNSKKIGLFFILIFTACFINICLYQYKNIPVLKRESAEDKIIKEEIDKDDKLKAFVLAWHKMKTDYYSDISSTELLNRSLNALSNKEDVNYTKVNNGFNEYYDFLTGIRFHNDRKSGVVSIAQIDDNLKDYKNKYNLFYGRKVLKINKILMQDLALNSVKSKQVSLSKEYSLTLKDDSGNEMEVILPNYNVEKNKRNYKLLENKKGKEKSFVYEENNMLVIDVSGGFDSFIVSTLKALSSKIKENKKYDGYIIDVRGNAGGSIAYQNLLSCSLGINSVDIDGLNESGKQKDILYAKSKMDKCSDYSDIVNYFKNEKFIVWMDENSASATELFISRLILSDKVKFTVGENTYGKGISQYTILLPDYFLKSFSYTSHILTINKNYTTQVYGIAPNIKIKFEGQEIKRMADSQHISPPAYLKRIPSNTYKEYIYRKEDLNKKDEIYYKATKENLKFDIPSWKKV